MCKGAIFRKILIVKLSNYTKISWFIHAWLTHFLRESDDMVEMVEVPDRVFGDGEEPIGINVLPYHSSRGISVNPLNSVRRRDSIFSGRFSHYILSGQLKVNKKYEAWFRFTGNPIRFYLRGFAIVTRSPCGKFQKKSRKNKKKLIAETLYWPFLFGGAEVVRVSSVTRMLRKKTFADRKVRIKYACLVLVSFVLMPTTLKSSIMKAYIG